MKIGDPFLGLVGNSNPLQVLSDHEPRSPPLQVLKEQLIGSHPIDPLTHHDDQFGMEWQNILLAMLRDGCLDGDSRRISVEAKALVIGYRLRRGVFAGAGLRGI